MNKGSIRICQMEESGSYWPDGSQAVLDPFVYLNFGWPDWSPEAVEEFPREDCFQLPAMATATADGVTDVTSVDGLSTSAIVSDCRSPSNSSPPAAQEHNRKKRPRPVAGAEPPSFKRPRSSTISFRRQDLSSGSSSSTNPDPHPDHEAIAQMKEMMYRAAAFRPVSFLPEETAKRPRRRNVRISSDPQTTAARIRRERVSERIRTLQKLVPGGRKMDTASILDEAANYLKFLKKQIKATENAATGRTEINGGRISFSTVPLSLCSYMQNYFNL